jgi:hypothetical protein
MICIEQSIADPSGRSIPCELYELQFAGEGRGWIVRTDVPPQHIAELSITAKDRQMPIPPQMASDHITQFPDFVPDMVKLSLGDKTVNIPRVDLLHGLRTGNVLYGRDAAYCHIPSLKVWLLSSDAKKLRTDRSAVLEYDKNLSDLFARYKKTGWGRERDRDLEKMRCASMVALVKPSGVKVAIPRDEIRVELNRAERNRAIGRRDGQDYRYFPKLGGFMSLTAVGIIEASNVFTFMLSDVANKLYPNVRGTRGLINPNAQLSTPYYTLGDNWYSMTPQIEQDYVKVMTPGTLVSAQDAVNAILAQRGRPHLKTDALVRMIRDAGKTPPPPPQITDQTMSARYGTPLHGGPNAPLDLAYEHAIWTSMSTRDWLDALHRKTPG